MTTDSDLKQRCWDHVATHHEPKVRALAARLANEPIMQLYYPWANHAGLHVCRDIYSKVETSVPLLLFTDTGDDSVALIRLSLAKDETLAHGDIETVLRAFIEALSQLPLT